jgi:hypothetical protein
MRTFCYPTPMFIRWQKRISRSDWGKPDIAWNAVLLDPIRINGKPRHRYIGCIASIKQSRIDMDDACLRCWFWDHALEQLHQFSNQVNELDRKRIIAMLSEKVPMPTRAEYKLCHRSVRESWGVERALPKYPLYKLPANFLDTLAPSGD